MNLNDYQKAAARTFKSDLSKEEMGDNILLGLIGETGEVSELVKKDRFHGKPLNVDRLIEEVGDALWYTAAEFTASELEMSIIDKTTFEELDAIAAIHELTDSLAIFGIYGTLSAGDVPASANRMCLLARILQNHGATLAQAAERNIEKLTTRYPNGFVKAP